MARSILLVEDDAAIATVIETAMSDEGFEVVRCPSVAERDRLLGQGDYAVMLTDVVLTDGDGIDGLGEIARARPDMPVIILSAQNTLDTAVRASDAGAFEYFPKPFDLDQLVRAVHQAVESRGGAASVAGEEPHAGLPMVGRSQAMQGVYRMITRVLRNDLTVLILGESGTGKELVAEAIHQLGHRKTGPFVAVNAAAIPGELIESELFGHEKGAFTGAVAQAIGKFEQANGGTLFLDEIGDMPADAQTRLLRALQSGRIRRVGGRQEIAVNVRIVAATNRDLTPMIREGRFREDLYYRLNVVPIQLPPLRDRAEDIESLARHFLGLAAAEGLPVRALHPSGLAVLRDHPWRGNVRELRNAIYRLALLAREDTIDALSVREVLGDTLAGEVERRDGSFGEALQGWLGEARPSDGALYHAALSAFERPLFEHALRRTGGNQVRASKLLGINRNTLRKRLVELGIDPERYVVR
jgi:two-component system, NtrC family, nitrogen regulation response regulator GlnG